MTNNLGIVIRFSDTLGDVYFDTIGEHNKILEQAGAVFVGKFGQPVAKRYLKFSSTENSHVQLILIRRTPQGHYNAYQAEIESAQSTRPESKLIPPYIRKRKDIKCWFKIIHPLKLISQYRLGKWITKSSNFPLIASLYTSMSGLFYVIYDKSAYSEPVIRRAKRKNVKGKGSKRKKRDEETPIDTLEEAGFYPSNEFSFEDDDTWQ